MRIGHQIYNYLYDYTDTGAYNVCQAVTYCDNLGGLACIKSAYINFKENQVYLIVENENFEQVHVNVHSFIKLMGGAKLQKSYHPLYILRNELKKYSKGIRKEYKLAKKNL